MVFTIGTYNFSLGLEVILVKHKIIDSKETDSIRQKIHHELHLEAQDKLRTEMIREMIRFTSHF